MRKEKYCELANYEQNKHYYQNIKIRFEITYSLSHIICDLYVKLL